MAAPTLYTDLEQIGRHATIQVHANWTQAESDDLDGAILARRSDFSGPQNNLRLAVEELDWTCSDGAEVTVWFDSMPPGPDGLVHQIPWGNSSGHRDFGSYPSACLAEPNKESPGNIVVTTRNALPNDNLFLTLKLKVKGSWNIAGQRTW